MVDASSGLEDTPGGIGASMIQFDDEDNPRAVGYATDQAREQIFSIAIRDAGLRLWNRVLSSLSDIFTCTQTIS